MTRKSTREVGKEWEAFAGVYLRQMNYQVLEYNYRCKRGEIDIVAKDGNCVVFCEVKYRSSGRFGTALEAVEGKKQKRISAAALFYITMHRLEALPCRFDVIGIEAGKIEHVKSAFEFKG